MKMVASQRLQMITQSLTVITGLTVSLLLAYSKITKKTLTLGDFTVLQIYMQELMQPLS
jgi:ABC-type transport system involved in Fe-S cluster assembly fused permease/ATPase subunit